MRQVLSWLLLVSSCRAFTTTTTHTTPSRHIKQYELLSSRKRTRRARNCRELLLSQFYLVIFSLAQRIPQQQHNKIPLTQSKCFPDSDSTNNHNNKTRQDEMRSNRKAIQVVLQIDLHLIMIVFVNTAQFSILRNDIYTYIYMYIHSNLLVGMIQKMFTKNFVVVYVQNKFQKTNQSTYAYIYICICIYGC